MITFRQHVPNYVDGVDPFTITVPDQAALLAHPWIANWAKDQKIAQRGEVRVRPFYRFSLSEQHLLGEWDEGRHWWVLGSILDGRDQLSLPTWVKHSSAQARIDAWNRGDVTFDDGRFAELPLATR